MFDSAIGWLRRHWWGLLVAYAIAIALSYTLITAVIEPLGIPDQFTSLWPILSNRSTYHIAGALFLGANMALLLELFVRRSYWSIKLAGDDTPPFEKGYSVKESKAFYDSIASQYDQRNSPSLLQTHAQVIRSIKETITGRQDVKVLDLGGGTGKLVAHHFFDSADIHWVYVDESVLMVEQFRRNLEGTKLDKSVQLEEISQYLRRKPDQLYDVIVLSLVLTSMESNPNWEQIASRLASNGRLIVAEIDAAYTATYPYYIVRTGTLRHALRPRAVPLTQLIHQARSAGLKLEHSHPISEGHLHYAFVAEFCK